jgi:sugar phosphate isomerase/epimerase
MGRINWQNVLEALADIDYKGEFTMESDAFLARYPEDMLPVATRFMADTTKYLADKLDSMLRK